MLPLLKLKMCPGHIALFCIVLFSVMLFWIALFCIAALIIVAPADISAAQTWDQKCEAYCCGAQGVWHFSGVVPTAKDDEILFTKGYGLAEISSSEPSSPETKYLRGAA